MIKLIAIKTFRVEVRQLENQRNLILNTEAELQILIWTQIPNTYMHVFSVFSEEWWISEAFNGEGTHAILSFSLW